MSVKRDLAGQTLGQFQVLEFKFTRKGHRYYMAKCSNCGHEKIQEASRLVSGIASCPCTRKPPGPPKVRFAAAEERRKQAFLNGFMTRAWRVT